MVVLLSPVERVQLLEQAFYAPMHDRDRMAALLCKAADLILCEYERGVPHDLSRLRHAELQRVSRHLRKYAHELTSIDPND